MSVPAGIGRVRYIGSGSTGPFAFNFVLYDTAHLTITKLDVNGVETTLTLTTDYSVVIAADFASATVTLVDALAGDGVDDGDSEILTITRDPPIQQLTQWPRNDPFPSQTHERAADLAVMMIGRLNEKLGRSLLLPETSTLTGLQIPNPTPNRAIGWNAAGDNLDNVDVPTMYVQNDAPTGDIPLNSLWIDANSTDYDLYMWDGDSWNDTGVNLKGIQGNTGPAGAVGTSGTISTDAMLAAASATEIKTTVLNYAGDLNSLAGSADRISMVRINTGATNVPSGAVVAGSHVQTYVWDASTARQIYMEFNSGLRRIWTREKISAVWSAWTTIGGGKQSIWVPAGAMHPTNANTQLQNVSFGTNGDLPIVPLDPSNIEFLRFSIGMPKGWNKGTITYKVYWSHPATTTNFTTLWRLEVGAFSNDDPITNSFGSQDVSQAGGTTHDLYITGESSPITVSGTIADEDLLRFTFFRVANDASDNLAVDAYLHGIKIYYNTVAGTDD